MNDLNKDKNSSLIAVSVENVGKAFRMYKRKRDRAKQMILKNDKKYYHEHWALKNISFNLEKGQSLGIIGRNGSGKSTLLQLICKTIKPTEGEIEVNGKVAALLELGSGFNPDFTGRENILLNGLLLGLTKKNIQERLDDILSFADIGEFVDQPVRTYSSGMAVRLAFSVIAHVDADILIIDEALAVGDAFFTQKCMRYIQRFRENGSLIFVSHDANAVLSLCNKAILINKGKLVVNGTPKEVIEEYTKDLQKSNTTKYTENKESKEKAEKDLNINKETKDMESIDKSRWSDYRTQLINSSNYSNTIYIDKFDGELIQSEALGGESAKITSVSIEILDGDNESNSQIKGGEVVRLKISFLAKETITRPITGFILKNDKGLVLLGDNTANKFIEKEEENFWITKGVHVDTEFIFTLPLLPEGEYSISASVAAGNQEKHEILHWINDALLLRSQCTSIAAGLAGVPMHSIKMKLRRQ